MFNCIYLIYLFSAFSSPIADVSFPPRGANFVVNESSVVYSNFLVIL